MLSFEQACRRIRKHQISVISVNYLWYAGENGVKTGIKAGAFVHITPYGGEREDAVVCDGATIEEAVEKYCSARGLS